MPHKFGSKTALCVLAAALTGPLYAQTAKSGAEEGLNAAPCKQVESACRSAGFHEHGEPEGKGLWVQCVTPLLEGHPASKGTKLPLPKVDDKVLAACRADNPNFGKGKAKKENPKE